MKQLRWFGMALVIAFWGLVAMPQNSTTVGTIGPRGYTGARGPAGTVTIGSVTMGDPGSTPIITNAGTASAAVWNIQIPRGSVMLSGTGAPGGGIGGNGDWYVDRTGGCLYGPKAGGAWSGSCVAFSGGTGGGGTGGGVPSVNSITTAVHVVGPNVTTAGDTITVASGEFSGVGKTFIFAGGSRAIVSSSCITADLSEASITSGTVSGGVLTAIETSGIQVNDRLTLSGFSGSYTGLNGQQVTVSTATGSQFTASVTGAANGSTGSGYWRCTYSPPAQFANLPAIKGSTVIQAAVGGNDTSALNSTYAATLGPKIEAAVATGSPTYVIVIDGEQDFIAMPPKTVTEVENNMKASWQKIHASGGIVVQQTIIPTFASALGNDSIQQQQTVNTWLKGQGRSSTTLPTGAYWDVLSPLAENIPDPYDPNLMMQSGPDSDHLTDVGALIEATVAANAIIAGGVYPAPNTAALSFTGICSYDVKNCWKLSAIQGGVVGRILGDAGTSTSDEANYYIFTAGSNSWYWWFRDRGGSTQWSLGWGASNHPDVGLSHDPSLPATLNLSGDYNGGLFGNYPMHGHDGRMYIGRLLMGDTAPSGACTGSTATTGDIQFTKDGNVRQCLAGTWQAPTWVGGGSMTYPSAGLGASTGSAWRAPTYSDVMATWSGCNSGNPILQYNGTCTSTAGGSGMTALTGDATASGTGSVPVTLATVNSSPGSCGDSTHVCQITTNGKGLVTNQTSVGVSGGGGAAGVTLVVTDATTQTITSGFNKLTFTTVVSDSASGWSAANNWYVVPTSGTYEIVTKVRIVDGATANQSYGHGANTSAADIPSFQWFATSLSSRNGSLNTRIAHFNVGDHILMYAYANSNMNTTALEMDIVYLNAN